MGDDKIKESEGPDSSTWFYKKEIRMLPVKERTLETNCIYSMRRGTGLR